MSQVTQTDGAVIRDGRETYVRVTAQWDDFLMPCGMTYSLEKISAENADGEQVTLSPLEQQLFAEELHPSNYEPNQ